MSTQPRNYIFLKVFLSVLLTLSISSKCFGNLAQAKTQINSFIKSGDLEAAETSIEQLKQSFADSPKLPETLYYIASEYAKYARVDEAAHMFQSVASDFPEHIKAYRAQMYAKTYNIISLIRKGKDSEAESEISTLRSEMSGSVDIAEALYWIANGYAFASKFDKANQLFASVASDFPEHRLASKAQIHAKRYNIISLIRKGKDTEAESEISALQSEISGSVDIANALYYIANGYASASKFDKANQLFASVASDFPEHRLASKAQMHAKRYNIISLIRKGKDTEAESEISALRSEMSDSADIADALYWIANGYASASKYDKAHQLFASVASDFPEHRKATGAQIYSKIYTIIDLIRENKFNEAEAELLILRSESAGKSQLADGLHRIGLEYGKALKYDKAEEMFRAVTTEFPTSGLASKSSNYADAYKAASLVNQGNDNDAQAIVADLKSNLANHSILPTLLIIIAEEYHNYGARMVATEVGSDNVFLTRSTQMLENDVLGHITRKGMISEIYLVLGSNYEGLGDYARSLEYYQRLAEEDQNHRLAWHAQFMVGRTFEKLVKEGLMPEDEGNPLVHQAYSTLLEKYPDCKAKPIAEKWLAKNSMSVQIPTDSNQL